MTVGTQRLSVATLCLVVVMSTALAGCRLIGGYVEQFVLAAEGAYLCTSEYGAHVSIPPGALPTDLLITMQEVAAPEELRDLDVVGPVYDFGPDGTRFSERVWVSLHPGTLPAGVAWSDLSLFNYSQGQVEELEDVVVDETQGTISGYTTHFSVFFAALSGPVGTRGIRIGGRNLMPLFGTSTSSNPPNVDLWFSSNGTVTSDPYSGQASDVLVIQVDDPAFADSQFYIEGWTVSPADPGAIGPTGEPISTNGFWPMFFAGQILGPMRTLKADSSGRLTLAIAASHLYSRMLNAPPGYSDGRFRLRVLSADPADAVDVYLSFGRLD